MAGLLCAACSGGGSQGTGTPTLDPICGRAPPGSQVVLYTATGLEYWYADVLTTFESDCDVSVYYAELSSAQVLQRLQVERNRPLADVVVAQPPYITQAADAGLLAGSDVREAAHVPADRCDRSRRWCTLIENYTSWVYNPFTVTPPPATWQDLLGPRFHGRLLTSRPDRAEDGIAMLALLYETEGREAALGYLASLEGSVAAHYNLTDTMSRLVAAGTDMAANGNLEEDLNDIDQYHNIKVWFPSSVAAQPTALAVPYGAALVRGAPDAVPARALLEWMWSPAGQQGAGRSNAAPARPDVVPSDARSQRLRATLQGVRILRIDWEQFGAVEAQLVSAWQRVARAPDGRALPTSPTPTPALPPPPPGPT